MVFRMVVSTYDVAMKSTTQVPVELQVTAMFASVVLILIAAGEAGESRVKVRPAQDSRWNRGPEIPQWRGNERANCHPMAVKNKHVSVSHVACLGYQVSCELYASLRIGCGYREEVRTDRTCKWSHVRGANGSR
jgi:hypothetical protein